MDRLRDRPHAVIFDMDGTLCNVQDIRHHVIGGNHNYHKFHRESVNSPANQWVVDAAVAHHEAGLHILVVTAREALFRNHTAFWLAMHGVPSDALFMRRNGDHRHDSEVKREILAQIRNRWNPILAYDDRPSVVELWRSEGIETIVVPGWEE